MSIDWDVSRPPRQRILAVGLLMTMLSSLYVAVVSPLSEWHSASTDAVEISGRRIQSLSRNLNAFRTDIDNGRVQIKRTNETLYFNGTVDEAGSALKTTIQAAAAAAGITVTSLNVTQPSDEHALTRLIVNTRFHASLSALVSFLDTIDKSNPKMFTTHCVLAIVDMSPVDGDAALDIQLDMVTYHGQE